MEFGECNNAKAEEALSGQANQTMATQNANRKRVIKDHRNPENDRFDGGAGR